MPVLVAKGMSELVWYMALVVLDAGLSVGVRLYGILTDSATTDDSLVYDSPDEIRWSSLWSTDGKVGDGIGMVAWL